MKSLLFLALLLTVFVTALLVVYAEHQSRKLFVEIQVLETVQNNLNEEWTRLLLEQSTWATDARIENIARNELGMEPPAANVMLVIE